MTKFIYTIHAEKRIKERNISKERIEEIYYNHNKVVLGEDDTEKAIKKFDNFEIIVIFEELKRKEKAIKIISVIKKRIKR